MHDQHLYQNPAIEVSGHCRIQLLWLRVPTWFFCNPGWKNCSHGWGFETTILDLCSQSGAYELSATVIPWKELLIKMVIVSESLELNCMLSIMVSNHSHFKNTHLKKWSSLLLRGEFVKLSIFTPPMRLIVGLLGIQTIEEGQYSSWDIKWSLLD